MAYGQGSIDDYSAEAIISKLGCESLTAADAHRLANPTEWLNDNIICFWSQLHQHLGPEAKHTWHTMGTFFYTSDSDANAMPANKRMGALKTLFAWFKVTSEASD